MKEEKEKKNRRSRWMRERRVVFYDHRGVTLFISLAITGALLLVGFAIVSTTVKQLVLSNTSRDSQQAFFAADSGMECALYWDLKSSTKPFSTTTPTPLPSISCNGVNTSPSRAYDGQVATTTFSVSPDPCIEVTVVKNYSAGALKTKIESKGYNTCNTSGVPRVQRAIRALY